MAALAIPFSLLARLLAVSRTAALPLPAAAARPSAESAPDFPALLEQMGVPAIPVEQPKASEPTLPGGAPAKFAAPTAPGVEPDALPEPLPVSGAPARKSTGRRALPAALLISAAPGWQLQSMAKADPQEPESRGSGDAVEAARVASQSDTDGPHRVRQRAEDAPETPAPALPIDQVAAPKELTVPHSDVQPSITRGSAPTTATPASPQLLDKPESAGLPVLPQSVVEHGDPELLPHADTPPLRAASTHQESVVAQADVQPSIGRAAAAAAATPTAPHAIPEPERDAPAPPVSEKRYFTRQPHAQPVEERAPQPAPDVSVPASPAAAAPPLGPTPVPASVQAQPLEPAPKSKPRASSPREPLPPTPALPQLSTPVAFVEAAEPLVTEPVLEDPAPAQAPPQPFPPSDAMPLFVASPGPAPLPAQPKTEVPAAEQIQPFRPPLVAPSEPAPFPVAATAASEPLVRAVSPATADRGEVAFVAHLRPVAAPDPVEPPAPPAPRAESAPTEKPLTPERPARTVAETREAQPRPEPAAATVHAAPQWTAPAGPRTQAAPVPIPESHPEPPQPASAPPPPAAPKPDAPPSPSAREIKLEVAGGEQRIEVRLSDRGGEVTVAVRTPDHQLAGTLRENLPQLTARLNESGLRSFEPAVASSEPHRTPETPSGSLRQDHPRQQQNPDPQGDADQRRQRHLEQPQPQNPKQKGNDFAWLMSSLR